MNKGVNKLLQVRHEVANGQARVSTNLRPEQRRLMERTLQLCDASLRQGDVDTAIDVLHAGVCALADKAN